MKWTHCKSIQMSDFLEIGCVEITMIDKHAVDSNKCICFVTDKKATGEGWANYVRRAWVSFESLTLAAP